MVRLINELVEGMNIDELEKLYQEEKTNVHQTRILLKLIFYAYSVKIYKCSEIAKVVKEDIHFLWLSEMSNPDYYTIQKFRSGKAKKVIEALFTEIIRFLGNQEYIIPENYIRNDNALNDYLSKQKILRKKEKHFLPGMDKKLKQLFKQIDELNAKYNSSNDLEKYIFPAIPKEAVTGLLNKLKKRKKGSI